MNSNQLIDNAEALRLFFTDDVYLAGEIPLVEKPFAEAVKPVSAATKTEIQQPPALNEERVDVPKIEEPTVSYQPTFDFKYLGKNEKSILILVNDAQNPVSTPQGTELLRKLVLSINLKNADFALVNYSNYTSAKFDHFHTFFSCKLIISFGVSAPTLGLGEQLSHQLNTFNNVKMIFTHNLHDLDADLNAKKLLWGTLKQLTI